MYDLLLSICRLPLTLCLLAGGTAVIHLFPSSRDSAGLAESSQSIIISGVGPVPPPPVPYPHARFHSSSISSSSLFSVGQYTVLSLCVALRAISLVLQRTNFLSLRPFSPTSLSMPCSLGSSPTLLSRPDAVYRLSRRQLDSN
ncbi:hypothetical protein B0T18DRAFT_83571 [Schizothecium vesticola]|uniref:Uncharacterized protein n=1 Tax=Schizothecium vesticola TaxID=314040 RepID=A0AA40F6B4_9PEZI|nr:hypothetical protein B0T18DRAFT_83571 [Schizothecium vesticola]